jgi:site-specific DNA-methyltransferase (adenine-specific)
MNETIVAKFRARDSLLKTGPAILDSHHQVLLGDARLMPDLNSESVHLVVTSPPYWNLKEYDGAAGKAQLGHADDYGQFLAELQRVWTRCFDALTPGGRLCIVVGDVCLPRKKHGRHSVVPLHADISRQCVDLGFDYLTPIFWHKIANAVTEVAGNGSGFLGKPYEPNGIVKNDVEYILLFRKPGAYRRPSEEQRLLSLIDKADHGRWFRSAWTDVRGQLRSLGHPAPFPVEIAYRLIRMFSFVGDVVLDPFVGTGSTIQAAMNASRNSVSYEVEPRYYELLEERFAQQQHGMTVSFLR